MIIVKIGGAAGVDVEHTCEDAAALWRAGNRLVLIHGGSDETNRLAEQLGQPPRFVTSVSGHTSRLTDRRTLEIFAMATAAINRRLVERLQALGVNAFGLSGIDGRLIEGRRKEAIRIVEHGRQRIVRDDWTGTPERVNRELLTSLLNAGLLLVVAPLAISPAGEMLNIDGDRGAAAIAGALRAETLILLTNVPGLLRRYPDENTLIRHLPRAALGDIGSSAEGRMRKKLLGAAEALAAGVQRVVISDGRLQAPISAALQGAGTVIE
ncbi:MAG: acetylglutamate kinase [Herpetosiphonaceae bacterium]|nr:MAG: acetylglutamate kinase [Herpetosiphonaceae bacterium]